MRKNNRNANPVTLSNLDRLRGKGKYARRARGPLAKCMSLALYLCMAVFAVYCGVAYVNQNDEVGYVGVVSAKANGIALSCGGKYDASAPAVFHPTLPCGTLVQVTNTLTGRTVYANVTNNAVMFRANKRRTADISAATATALNLNPDARAPVILSLRALQGKWQGVLQRTPVWADFQPQHAQASLPSQKEIKALTLNMLGECQICGENGMIAVAQVTLNRLDQGFNGKNSIHTVVYDANQFSWTRYPKGDKRNPPYAGKSFEKAKKLAIQVLSGDLSGDELAILYHVTTDATYYYAFDVIKTPYWGSRGGKLEVVPMPNTLEVELWHRFFREKGTGTNVMASK